jgi:BMFP domain-containing protein YqiC
MMKKSLEAFIKQCSDILPPHLHTMKSEFEEALHGGVALALQKLNLVTREEFDIQVQVLAKTRDKLEKLETKVALLENFYSLDNSEASCKNDK